MPRWAWSIGLVLSACATPEPPVAPAAGLEVRATLIAVEDSNGVAVRAFDGEEVGFSSEPALGASVVLLRYDRGLEALGLPRARHAPTQMEFNSVQHIHVNAAKKCVGLGLTRLATCAQVVHASGSTIYS